MWQPEPGWQQLPGGTSPSVYGVWLALEGDREVIAKRLPVSYTHLTLPTTPYV